MNGRGKKPNREWWSSPEVEQNWEVVPLVWVILGEAMWAEPRSLGCQAEEARTTVGTCPGESWGQEGRGCPPGPCQIPQEAGKERANSPASLFLCLQSLPGLLIALTYQESKNKGACENRAWAGWRWAWDLGEHALSTRNEKKLYLIGGWARYPPWDGKESETT